MKVLTAPAGLEMLRGCAGISIYAGHGITLGADHITHVSPRHPTSCRCEYCGTHLATITENCRNCGAPHRAKEGEES